LQDPQRDTRCVSLQEDKWQTEGDARLIEVAEGVSWKYVTEEILGRRNVASISIESIY